MKLEKLVGDSFKERPADCAIDSHALMIRGGYIKYVANGIYSSYPILRRITKKIEQIIREEMDAIDGQEVLFPVALPASIWQESGRYDSVGSTMVRFRDRNDNTMLLGPTHEEAAVHLVREYGQSYAKYPLMVYQINTKFRDETRPRGGLIRLREFSMKDAYSFHTSQEDLEDYFMRCYHAYKRIWSRVGLPQVFSVDSDSGMMGGSMSKEFMLLTSIGEDSIVTCNNCDYQVNMEAAESIVMNEKVETAKPLEKVHTPNMITIDDVCVFLNKPIEKSCKAVVYQKNITDEYVVVFIRGDLDINEIKLENHLHEEIHPADITGDSNLSAGFIGPCKLYDINVLFDRSLNGIENLCCGANEVDYHYVNVCIERDVGHLEYHDFAKAVEGGLCPQCNNPSLKITRGIELGHIFQLDTKYTKSMKMSYLDEKGISHHPLMCCYGIGISRLAASVCEIHHDEYGPIWPLSIAPWQVHLCCVKAVDENVKAIADKFYAQMLQEKIEVIYDDRPVAAGVIFSDADLLGVPVRLIVSPRNVKDNCCEIVMRDKSMNQIVNIDDTVASLQKLLVELQKGYE